MSREPQRNMSGSLFKNKDKDPNDEAQAKYADYNGSATIDGVEYWMNAWLKTSASGLKWMSFSFKPKNEQAPKDNRPTREVIDDDLPF